MLHIISVKSESLQTAVILDAGQKSLSGVECFHLQHLLAQSALEWSGSQVRWQVICAIALVAASHVSWEVCYAWWDWCRRHSRRASPICT